MRSAVASCLVRLVATWTTLETSPDIVRVSRLMSSCTVNAAHRHGASTFAGIRLSMNGLARPYHHATADNCLRPNLKMLVDVLFNLLVTSHSKFTKVVGNSSCFYCSSLIISKKKYMSRKNSVTNPERNFECILREKR